jgi:hypothetical protein
MQRLKRAGFRNTERRDLQLTNRFPSVDDYIDYRRGFGKPADATDGFYERYIRATSRRRPRTQMPTAASPSAGRSASSVHSADTRKRSPA